MRIKPTTGSVVGKTDATHWGQVLLTPTIYGVVEVDDPEGAARVIGLRVLSAVTRGVEDVTSLADVVSLLNNAKEPSVKTLILVAPIGAVVYIAATGTGTVFLKRGEQLAKLVENEGTISGELKENDTLLLASFGFISTLSQEELMAIFDHLSPLEVAEKLTLLLHEKSEVLGSAALILQAANVEPMAEEAIEEVVSVAQPAATSAMGTRRIRQRVGRMVHRVRGMSLREWITGKKIKVLGAGIILAVFVISILLGIVKERGKGNSQEVLQAVTQAQYVFDEGVALLPLNPVKGRERLMEAKAMLEPFTASVSGKTREGRQVAALYKNIVDNLAAAMQVTTGEPELFFDVSLLKKGAVASRISIRDETLGIADAATNTLYTLAVAAKNGQVAGGGEALGRVTDVTLHGDMVYTLTDTGIARVSATTKKATPDVVKKDDEWGTIASIVTFAGNLYLLDTQKSRIWKYVATEKGFSELREYLNPDAFPDLSRATGMAIDGSVWVGTSEAKIMRFTQGKENTFIPKGVEPGFGSFLLVYTSDEVDNVYVLDRDNKRVVVLDKDGVYMAQYTWQGAVAPSQFVVSETLKKILLLADGKIYSIELK